MILAPVAAMFLQMALSRSREYEADRSGARLLGTGEPLARALPSWNRACAAVPSNVDPAHASAYIANPLAGRKMQFKNLWSTHPPMEDRIRRLREATRSFGTRVPTCELGPPVPLGWSGLPAAPSWGSTSKLDRCPGEARERSPPAPLLARAGPVVRRRISPGSS